MEKVKNAVLSLLTAMKKRADEATACQIGELMDVIQNWQPKSKAA